MPDEAWSKLREDCCGGSEMLGFGMVDEACKDSKGAAHAKVDSPGSKLSGVAGNETSLICAVVGIETRRPELQDDSCETLRGRGWVRDCPGIAAEGIVEWPRSKEALSLEGLREGSSRQPLAVDSFGYVIVVGDACFGKPVRVEHVVR